MYRAGDVGSAVIVLGPTVDEVERVCGHGRTFSRPWVIVDDRPVVGCDQDARRQAWKSDGRDSSVNT